MGKRLEMKDKNTIMPDDEIFSILPNRPLRIDEVAMFFSVTKRTIYTWYMSDHLSGCNINGKIRIYRKSVIDLVISNNGKKNGLGNSIEIEEKIHKTDKTTRRRSGWVTNF